MTGPEQRSAAYILGELLTLTLRVQAGSAEEAEIARAARGAAETLDPFVMVLASISIASLLVQDVAVARDVTPIEAWMRHVDAIALEALDPERDDPDGHSPSDGEIS